MEKSNQTLSLIDKNKYIHLITERFLSNPRMSMLFDVQSKSFKKNVQNLVKYCFLVAYKNNGVYIAKNQKTIMLFYEKQNLKKDFYDYFRYLKVVLGIPLNKITQTLKNEKITESHKLKKENFIYVWFIAQEFGYGKIDGLIEINNFLNELSNLRKLPVLFETSDKNLLHLYQRAGFELYKTISINNESIFYFINNKWTN